MNYREEIASKVDHVVRGLGDTRCGSMFGYPAFFAGRKMFACVYGEGVAVRLTQAETSGTGAVVREFRPHGRTMRRWVLLVYVNQNAIQHDRALFQRAIQGLAG